MGEREKTSRQRTTHLTGDKMEEEKMPKILQQTNISQMVSYVTKNFFLHDFLCFGLSNILQIIVTALILLLSLIAVVLSKLIKWLI